MFLIKNMLICIGDNIVVVVEYGVYERKSNFFWYCLFSGCFLVNCF